jgi:hypothetical protein
MEACARENGTNRNKVLVPQIAMLQVNLKCTCNTFWQRLASNGTMVLDARATANTLYACAKLVQHQLASPQCTGMSLQAVSALQVLRANHLRNVLLGAAERMTRSMNSQEVPNTVCAQANLDMPPSGSLCDVLWLAAERVAPSMKSQAVANMVRALANLDMPLVGSLRDHSGQPLSA